MVVSSLASLPRTPKRSFSSFVVVVVPARARAAVSAVYHLGFENPAEVVSVLCAPVAEPEAPVVVAPVEHLLPAAAAVVCAVFLLRARFRFQTTTTTEEETEDEEAQHHRASFPRVDDDVAVVARLRNNSETKPPKRRGEKRDRARESASQSIGKEGRSSSSRCFGGVASSFLSRVLLMWRIFEFFQRLFPLFFARARASVFRGENERANGSFVGVFFLSSHCECFLYGIH